MSRKTEMKQFIHTPCSVRVVSHVPRPHNKVTADVVYYRFRTNQLTTERKYKYTILKSESATCTVLNVLISSFLRRVVNGGSGDFWCGEWDGGDEEGALAIETVLQLPVPTPTFLHPISRKRRKGRTSIK